MIDRIYDVLEKIYAGVYEEQSRKDTSYPLICDAIGELLFRYKYKYVLHNAYPNEFQKSIEIIIAKTSSINNLNFWTGKAGVNWFYGVLHDDEVLSTSSWEILSSDDEKLMEYALLELQRGNYDFFYGSIGVLFYILKYKRKIFRNNSTTIFNCLNNLSNRNQLSIIPYILENDIKVNQISIGLAHGIPSVLKLCLECVKYDVNSESAIAYSYKIIDFLKANINKECEYNFFSNFIKNNEIPNEKTRLAWCYGDLGVGIILFQSAVILDDKELRKFALDVLLLTTKRAKEQTFVHDAGICHGSAGIAHIYNKIWRYTGDVVFKKACDFWIQETFNYAIYRDDKIVFESYSREKDAFEENFGLLEGSAGIGLVLLSYLTGDFSWDHSLMLND